MLQQPLPTASGNYRPDIDGLRALAVLLVVIFHAFPAALPGGFIGVDVFFVISGYLITTILLDAHREGRFSLITFYARRARRILPALALVLLAVFIAGWIMLLPDQFGQLGLHILASAAFFQNIILMREAGYFDQSSELKPLNHLWSLGVEEQFYLVYPLLLMLVLRWRNGPWLALTGLALASFALNVSRVTIAPVETFFLLPSRFWELLAGGLLSVMASRARDGAAWKADVHSRMSNGASLLGLAMITGSALFLTPAHPFPGWAALCPVIGAVLVIQAGESSVLNQRLLSHPIAVTIGLISYPLYLWHWPLLAFAKLVYGESLTAWLRLALIGLSIVLAYATYRLIEIPVRFGQNRDRKAVLATAATIVCGALGAITIWQDGFGFRARDRAEFIAHFENAPPELRYMMANRIWEKNRVDCNFYDAPAWRAGNPNPPARQNIAEDCTTPTTPRSILIWGDSHASHLYHGLREALPAEISVLIVGTSGCAPNLPGRMQPSAETCERSTALALETTRKFKPELVIIAQWKGHGIVSPLDEIATSLRQAGASRVMLVGPVPQWEPYLYRVMAGTYWHLKPRRLNVHLKAEPMEVDAALAQSPGVKSGLLEYASLVRFLCSPEGCLTHHGDNLRDGLITYDYGHFTPESSSMIAREMLAPLVLKAAKP